MRVKNANEKAAATLGAQARKLAMARSKADRAHRTKLTSAWLQAERKVNSLQDTVGKAMRAADVDAIEVDGVRIVKTSPSQAVPLRATAQGFVQQINELLDEETYGIVILREDETIALLADIREWLTA